jgi:hypothetical protein
VVGIETGTVTKKGTVGRGAGSPRGRTIRREPVRRSVDDVGLCLKRMANPAVLPDVELTGRISYTVIPDIAPIPTTRRNRIDLLDVVLIPTRKRTEKGHTVLPDAPNVREDPVRRALVHSLLVLLPLRHRPLLFHLKWTSISRNHMTPA